MPSSVIYGAALTFYCPCCGAYGRAMPEIDVIEWINCACLPGVGRCGRCSVHCESGCQREGTQR